jgi:hypothetical protein
MHQAVVGCINHIDRHVCAVAKHVGVNGRIDEADVE